MIRVFLLDDHALTRAGLAFILESIGGFEIVGQCGTGEEALTVMPSLASDILLCDLYLPGISGAEVVERLRRFSNPPKVVVLSAQDSGPMPRRLLAAGVAGYLCKGCLPSELARGLREVAGWGRHVDPKVARHIAFDSIADGAETPFDRLTDRELEILLQVLRGRRIQEIATDPHLSHKTVSSHKLNAMNKLSVSNLPAATRLALRYAVLDPVSA